MTIETFLAVYFVLLISVIIIEICLLRNDKGKYLRRSYEGLLSIISERDNFDRFNDLVDEIESFYNRFYQTKPAVKKLFPNVISWLDEILFRIDIGFGYAKNLKENSMLIRNVRLELGKRYPFSKCEKYQQSILNSIAKLKNQDNISQIEDVLIRTEEEFLKLSSDIRKNQWANVISIMIGIIGIIVSILMALVKV